MVRQACSSLLHWPPEVLKVGFERLSWEGSLCMVTSRFLISGRVVDGAPQYHGGYIYSWRDQSSRPLSQMGLRCSTPALLVSTCCIDIRAGGTIPGALGGHLAIRPTARGALLLAWCGSLLVVLLLMTCGIGWLFTCSAVYCCCYT